MKEGGFVYSNLVEQHWVLFGFSYSAVLVKQCSGERRLVVAIVAVVLSTGLAAAAASATLSSEKWTWEVLVQGKLSV